MKSKKRFSADLLDLELAENRGAVLWRAGKVTAVEARDGTVFCTVPFHAVEALTGEKNYQPALEEQKVKEHLVRIVACGEEVLRVSLVPGNNTLMENSVMLERTEQVAVVALTLETAENGWQILDEKGVVRAVVDNAKPDFNTWNNKAEEWIDSLNLTLYPDGKTAVPLNGADRFFNGMFDSLPLCLVEKDGEVFKSGFAVKAEASETFCGTGERFAKLDLSGQTIELDNTDGLGVNSRRAYKNIPFYMSSKQYGLFMHTSHSVRLSLAGDSTRSVIGVQESPVLDLFVMGGGSLERVLFNYRSLTGFPAALPLWSYGTWMSRMTYFTADEVNGIADRLRAEKYPCDVLHLDTGWFAKDWVCEWLFSETSFPDPTGFMNGLKDKGFRTTLWQTPYISKDNCWLETTRKNNYIGVPRQSSTVSASDFSGQDVGGHLDFSNPETITWYKGLLKDLLNKGASAIKTDFGEDITDAEYQMPQEELHNLYALLYQKAAYEITKDETGDGIIWARAGWAGCQRYPLHWGGDAESSWEGLAASLRGGLHLGLSGFAFWSHDVAGFHGTPSFMHSMTPDDIYVRWTQFGVFSSHLRYHGTSPREPWEYPNVAPIVRKWLNLRYALIPYLMQEQDRAVASGMPVLRALPLHHADDPTCWHIDDQYYLGGDIMVAPVMNSENVRDIYLPTGEWVDFWTGESQAGERWLKGVECPLERMPLYVRNGASLPLYPDLVQSTCEMNLNKAEAVVFDSSYKGFGATVVGLQIGF